MKSRVIFILALILLPFLLNAQIVEKGYGKKGDGFKGIHGEWIVKPIYDEAIWDKYTKIGVLKNHTGKWGAVDEFGTLIIPFEFDEISVRLSDYDVNDQIYIAQEREGHKCHGLWDKKRGLLVPCEFAAVYYGDKAITIKTHDNHFGLYDHNGHLILEPIYSNFLYFNSDTPNIRLLNLGGNGDEYNPIGGKWGAVSYNGDIIIPCIYDECIITKDNIYPVKRNGKWGFFSLGKEIIPCIYDNVTPFENDVAQVRQGANIELLKNPLNNKNPIQLGDCISINISSNDNNGDPKVNKVTSRYPIANSDVDNNIPRAKSTNENTFAFIIANENYESAPVPYALNDGWKFKEYVEKALGVPSQNISLYEDATYAAIVSAVERIKEIAIAYEGSASIIFYYAGHGFPDEKQKSAYLLPVDGLVSDISVTGYSLAKLYQEISKLPLKTSVFFLDACFSGAVREDKMLDESRGIAIKVNEEIPHGNIVVFSASQGDETAHQLTDKTHGLFTYYLLKAIQDSNGNITLGNLSDSVIKNVKRQSVVINSKKQTPTVIPSVNIGDNWRNIKL